jgi:6-phosphogluconate dehydrogenase (decarboxylating)
VDDLGLLGGTRGQRAVAALAVGDPAPGYEREDPREDDVAQAPVGEHPVDPAPKA